MNRLYNGIFWLLFISSGLISCSSDNDSQVNTDDGNTQLPLEAETFLNVTYGSHPQQVYDLYLPEGRTAEKTKVLVLIHGGGWIEGDKSDMQDFIPLIQLHHPDHAIVNMNYVLATTTQPAFPNQFLDVERVLDKIQDESESLQVLPEFGLIGASAGAHLSLQFDSVYDPNDRVKMVCDIVGPTDFTDPFYASDPNFNILLSLLVDENAYPPGTVLQEVVSPALQVNTATSPTIMFYGDMDPLVPLSNGVRLKNALTNQMVTNQFTVYEGGHGDDWSEASQADLQLQLNAFIEAHLPIVD